MSDTIELAGRTLPALRYIDAGKVAGNPTEDGLWAAVVPLGESGFVASISAYASPPHSYAFLISTSRDPSYLSYICSLFDNAINENPAFEPFVYESVRCGDAADALAHIIELSS